MRRTGWRVTPASMLPTLVAVLLASLLGLPAEGSAPTSAALTSAALTSAALTSAAPTRSAPTGPVATASDHATAAHAQTQAPAARPAAGAWTAMATDPLNPSRVAQTGSTTAGHAGPGAALATLSYRLSLDRLRRLVSISTGGHPAGTGFSSFRSRAPPRTSW